MAFSDESLRVSRGTKSVYLVHIDLLRAIAVVSVVFFHYFPSSTFAGFLGVDIFFVISGYLITGHVVTQIATGSFSFSSFYGKRIRRLFPALALVILAVLLGGELLLDAKSFASLGSHTFYSSVFLQNFNLASEAGYFDVSSEKKPLLHLWSLSIEEQFYIFLPIVLLCASKLKFSANLTLLIGCIASYVLLQTSAVDSTRFYWPQFRVWELLFGSLVWSLQTKIDFFSKELKVFDRSSVRNLMLVFSCCLIAVGFVITSEKSFPNLLAWVTLSGSGMFIIFGGQLSTFRESSFIKTTSFVGKISYPLYLWHWPLLSIATIVYGESLSYAVLGSMLVATFLLSVGTYYLVEQPLRFGTQLSLKTASLIVIMFGILVAGMLISHYEGFPNRASNQLVERYVGDIGHDVFHEEIESQFHPCQPVGIRREALRWIDHVRCQQSQKQGTPKVLILGDSHAEHLFYGLARKLTSFNVGYYIQGGYPSIKNPGFSNIFEYVLSSNEIEVVILSAYWPMYLEHNFSEDGQKEEFRDQLAETILSLKKSGKKVVLFGGTPDFNFDPENCKYARKIGKSKCEQDLTEYNEFSTMASNVVEVVQNTSGVVGLTGFDLLCTPICSMVSENNYLLYRDRNHLNLYGSALVGEFIAKTLLKEGLIENY